MCYSFKKISKDKKMTEPLINKILRLEMAKMKKCSV
jgi:hypothetical protein